MWFIKVIIWIVVSQKKNISFNSWLPIDSSLGFKTTNTKVTKVSFLKKYKCQTNKVKQQINRFLLLRKVSKFLRKYSKRIN